MFARIQTRLSSEEGFTLIELLVVIIILGILVAIAVPSYLSLTGSAKNAAAKSNVSSAFPVAETYYQTATSATPPGGGGTYTGLDRSTMNALAPGIGPNVLAAEDTNGYCVVDTEDGGTNYAWYSGGTGGTSTVTYGTKAEAATACPKATYTGGDSSNTLWPG